MSYVFCLALHMRTQE